MPYIDRLRTVTDVATITRTGDDAATYRYDEAYSDLALSYDDRVQKGACDPLVAEAALSDHLETEADAYLHTPAAILGSKALERLVVRGALDPIIAESVLDEQFDVWSVRNALNGIE